VVFTLDHLVNPLAEVNPEAIYSLLFSAANQTLKAFASQYLGGEIGVTAVLHTWGQTLQHHIHLHCMVTAGALVQAKRGRSGGVATEGRSLVCDRAKMPVGLRTAKGPAFMTWV